MKTLGTLLTLLSLCLVAVGCTKVEDAAKDTGAAIEDAAEDTGDAIEEGADKVKEEL